MELVETMMGSTVDIEKEDGNCCEVEDRCGQEAGVRSRVLNRVCTKKQSRHGPQTLLTD